MHLIIGSKIKEGMLTATRSRLTTRHDQKISPGSPNPLFDGFPCSKEDHHGITLVVGLHPYEVTAPLDNLFHTPTYHWGGLEKVGKVSVFLVDNPVYATGEIIHVDCGSQLG